MASHPFVVPVTSILRAGDPRPVVCAAPADDLFVTGSGVPAGGEVGIDAVLEPAGPALWLVGTVSAPWEGECRRCLQPVHGRLEAQVRELFEPDPVTDETWPIDHDQIDLEPLVREAVLLELPPAPLCSEDCQGLCPECGTDRNTGACRCRPPVDPRWGALDELRTD